MTKQKPVSTLISAAHRRKLDVVRRVTGIKICAFIEQAIDEAYRRVAKGKVKSCCNHQGCDKPYDIENQSRYRQPLRLCGKHYNELERMAVGSQAERIFLYRCGIIRDEVIDATVDALVKVI